MKVRSATRRVIVLPGVLMLVGGCAGEEPADIGSCDGFVGFGDAVYEIHNETVDRVAGGIRLGKGESLDCDKRAVQAVGVYRIDGVRPKMAIAVPDSSEAGRYVVWVAEGTEPQDWPDAIRQES